MKWLIVLAVLLFFGVPQARAQAPQPTRCIATLNVTTANVLASTATIGPSAFPACQWPQSNTFPGLVFVYNDKASSGSVYVCPMGDSATTACSTSNGLEIPAGNSWGFYQPASAMKIVGASTATVQFQW